MTTPWGRSESAKTTRQHRDKRAGTADSEPMFDRILVPLDGSAQSAAALPLARMLAQACHSQLTLMRVATSPAAGEEVATYLARIASELQTAELTVTTEVCSGIDVAPQILWAARDRHVDLIVMATHGRSGMQRALMGSVAESIVAESSVPVLLVRPGGHRSTSLRKLLVALDGTPGAALALGHAIALARATGAGIVLLQVAVPIRCGCTRRSSARRWPCPWIPVGTTRLHVLRRATSMLWRSGCVTLVSTLKGVRDSVTLSPPLTLQLTKSRLT